MHPFCCVSVVSDHSSPVTLDMPPIPAAPRSDPAHRTGQALHSLTNDGEGGRGHPLPFPAAVDVRIKDLVGNGISGILHKWVNYGKGWRTRWFVLQDGVLSYYKIHGPDKIIVNSETEKGSKVIGEESGRLISRNRNSNHVDRRRKPVGEIHLKVSTIRESRSDDKRFSVFTGTKRLHLRAETHDDRVAWMDALQAVKDMFPRISNSELMAPVDNVAVSTEKLRLRLMEDGVSEETIRDSEQIMRNEYAALQNQLLLLKQKQVALIDTLRQLEVPLMKSRKLEANQTGYSWWISTTAQKAGHS